MSSVTNTQGSNPLIVAKPAGPNMGRPSRLHYSVKLAQTVLLIPITSTIKLAGRVVKLITWDLGKAATLKALGYHNEAGTFLEMQYLKTVSAVRDLLFIPVVAHSTFKDIIAKREEFADDLSVSKNYLNVTHTKKFDYFSSYMHGKKTVEVIHPTGIQEFAAESDGDLNTVMASNFLKPDVMAINFGIPNVATFVTEAKDDGSIQTVKVDAKSLKRAKMAYHPTNGKIQSGIFFVPTNLPAEALERFKEAAKKLEGRADVTCVNTNCRVLKEAGFSIEGRDLDDVILPTTMLEHFLYRNVLYTDNEGKKHQVHFDLINTTKQTLEEHWDKIDIAVLGTRLRHGRRNSDTEEKREARGAAAKALIALEKERLGQASLAEQNAPDLTKRKISVSVPSCLGDAISRIWGRHTLYEVDLSDKKEAIEQGFKEYAKLRPFPQEKPSLATRVKRDFFFSQTMINFLRRHIMGRMDTLYLNTQDLFSHLKSTDGERLNYVVLDDKVVFMKVNANLNKEEKVRKAADWALSKHALLAGRQDVYCSGEMWFDKNKERFMVNQDSGTYMPKQEQVKIVVNLANEIFKTDAFEVVEAA